MNGCLAYMLETVVCCGLFAALYAFLIEGRVPHRAACRYIVAGALLSAAIPAMNIPLYPTRRAVHAAVVVAEPRAAVAVATGNGAAPTVAAAASDSDGDGTALALPALFYCIAVLANLVSPVRYMLLIARLRREADVTECGTYRLAESDRVREPFTFGRTVFMNRSFEGHEREQVLAHECSHVRHRHTAERLVLELLRCVLWFNPFLWLAAKRLSEVQEWEADGDVLCAGYDIHEYRTIIFRQLFGYDPDIACGLNNRITKKRFLMMTDFKRGKLPFMRLGAAVPLAAGMILAFGCVRVSTDTVPAGRYVVTGDTPSDGGTANDGAGIRSDDVVAEMVFGDDGTVEVMAGESTERTFSSGVYGYTLSKGRLRLSGDGEEYVMECEMRRSEDGSPVLRIVLPDDSVCEAFLSGGLSVEDYAALGRMLTRRYEGLLPAASCPGIRYSLTLRHREGSGDGTFRLVMTYIEAEDGRDVSFVSTGRRYTQRGMAGDDNATVWQLACDDGETINFLYNAADDTLTLLTADFEMPESGLNYTLEAVE